MKNNMIFWTLAMAGLFIASCSKEELQKQSETSELVTLVASTGNETRTIRQEDGSVWWDTKENIKVFCLNGASGKFTSQNIEPSSIAEFTGTFDKTVSLEDISKKGIVALYPYSENAYYDDGGVVFTIPSEQYGKVGTFDNDLFPCIAYSKSTDLSFKNICAGIKFTVTNDDIRSVSFKGNRDEPLAGKIKTYDSECVDVIEGRSEITVYAPGDGYFEVGKEYYIVMLPPEWPTRIFWSGFTITYNKDNVSDSYSFNGYAELKPSTFGFIRDMDKSLLFIDHTKPIQFADATMKDMCVTAFDANSDGELSYGEAKAVTDLSKMKLTNKTIRSFDEFQYFINVQIIPEYYFQETHLESITLHENLKHINGYAFSGCAKLRNINLVDGIEFIGSYAFDGCSSLSGIIKLPENLEKINTYTFRECSNVEEFVFPQKLSVINGYAFDSCSKLRIARLPECLTSIGYAAFRCCSNLETLSIPNTVNAIDGRAFWGCSSLSGTIVLPKSLLKVSDYLFYDCSGLDEVILPDNIMSIGNSAFSGCSNMKSITIPNCVTTIKDWAFCGCRSLESVFLKCQTPPSLPHDYDTRYTFYENSGDRKFYVPKSAIASYKSSDDWYEYIDSLVGYDYEY